MVIMKKFECPHFLSCFIALGISFIFINSSSYAQPSDDEKSQGQVIQPQEKKESRPPFDQQYFKKAGDSVTFHHSNWDEMNRNGLFQRILKDSGLELHIFQALLEDSPLVFKATYDGSTVKSQFIPDYTLIPGNQENSQEIKEVESLNKELDQYATTGQTFADSVRNLYRNFRDANPARRMDLNEKRLERQGSIGKKEAALDILLSQEPVEELVKEFVPVLAKCHDPVQAIDYTAI
jgi:hypothetical protein